MKLELNRTHRWGEQLEDLPQDVIAACPSIGWGCAPDDPIIATLPSEVRKRLDAFPWGFGGTRKYQWIYVRPQVIDVTKADTRSGNFYHLDVDSIYRCVAPAWDEFREIAVSFGDIAEVEFIAEPMTINANDRPSSNDYVTLSGNFNRAFATESPKNAQLALYTGLDAHRAGPIRRSGNRLFLIAFETNQPPSPVWPAQ